MFNKKTKTQKEMNEFQKEKGNGAPDLKSAIRLKEGFRERLSKAMPPNAIQPHPTKGYLSTIKSMYVVERLNDVFGICGWDFEHEVFEKTNKNVYDKSGVLIGTVPYVVVKGRIYVREFDLYSPYQYGGAELDGKGKEPADGYKSAVTDALSKCASYLEIGIQVFKGNPSSTENNVSKRLDQPVVSEPENKYEAGTEVQEEDEDTIETEGKPVEPEKPKRGRKPSKGLPKSNDELEAAFAKETDKVEVNTEEETVNVEKPAPIIERYKKIISEYVDSTYLAQKAKDILFDATLDGASEEEQAEIKNEVNKRWTYLKGIKK